jgi:hypothetical protein
MQAQFSFWQFRPVKLVNRLQIRNSLISSDCTQIRSLPSSESLELIPGMLLEVLPHSVLVFCPTRSGEPPSMLHFLGCF